MQILVLGMHRSGTSLTTRLINMMGAYFAPEGMAVETRADNPKGYWERKDILKINQRLVAHFRAGKPGIPKEVHKDMQRVILGIDGFRPWVAKDPRFCLTLPQWLNNLEVPLGVIVWRDPMEIAHSLQSREGKTIAQGIALWEYYAVHLIRHAHALPKIFTTHAGMMADPVATVRSLHKDLIHNGIQGIRMPSEREILAFLDPTLYHEREQGGGGLTALQKKICAMLRGEMPFDPKIKLSAQTEEIMAVGKKKEGK